MTIRACGHLSTNYDGGRCIVCDRNSRDRRRYKDGSTPTPKANRIASPVVGAPVTSKPIESEPALSAASPNSAGRPHPPPAARQDNLTKAGRRVQREARLCAVCSTQIVTGQTMVPAAGRGVSTSWAHKSCMHAVNS